MPARRVNAANKFGAGEVSVRVSEGKVNFGNVKENPNCSACGIVVPCDGERDAAGESNQTQQEHAADHYQGDEHSDACRHGSTSLYKHSPSKGTRARHRPHKCAPKAINATRSCAEKKRRDTSTIGSRATDSYGFHRLLGAASPYRLSREGVGGAIHPDPSALSIAAGLF